MGLNEKQLRGYRVQGAGCWVLGTGYWVPSYLVL